MQKYPNLVQFYGKTHGVYAQFHFLAPKTVLLPPSYTLRTTEKDPRYSLFYHARCPAFRRGTFFQIEMVVVRVTFSFSVGSYILLLRLRLKVKSLLIILYFPPYMKRFLPMCCKTTFIDCDLIKPYPIYSKGATLCT